MVIPNLDWAMSQFGIGSNSSVGPVPSNQLSARTVYDCFRRELRWKPFVLKPPLLQQRGALQNPRVERCVSRITPNETHRRKNVSCSVDNR